MSGITKWIGCLSPKLKKCNLESKAMNPIRVRESPGILSKDVNRALARDGM